MASANQQSQDSEFGDTLESFGYQFNEAGQLRQIKNGESFVFDVSAGDTSKNQRHYEALGEVITKEVYALLEKEGLQRLPVPADASKSKPSTFIFGSADWKKNPDRLLVLIHGSGVVRAGQWARRLIINEDLDKGTQLPFIRWGMANGFAVLVMNTNQDVDGAGKVVKASKDPIAHGEHVWKHYVSKAPAKHIAIVAHSYGGHVTVSLTFKYLEEMQKRVFAIALTDSAHGFSDYKRNSGKVQLFLNKIARNYRASAERTGTFLESGEHSRIPAYSAGHLAHEWTSWSAENHIYRFLVEALQKVDSSFTPKFMPPAAADIDLGDEDEKMSYCEECDESLEKKPGDAAYEHQLSGDDSPPAAEADCASLEATADVHHSDPSGSS